MTVMRAVFAADLFNEPWGASWGPTATTQGSKGGGRKLDDADADADDGASDESGDRLGGGGADRNASERDQGGERDWTTAAASLGAAVGAACPRWLIFVEGVGTASGEEVTLTTD